MKLVTGTVILSLIAIGLQPDVVRSSGYGLRPNRDRNLI